MVRGLVVDFGPYFSQSGSKIAFHGTTGALRDVTYVYFNLIKKGPLLHFYFYFYFVYYAPGPELINGPDDFVQHRKELSKGSEFFKRCFFPSQTWPRLFDTSFYYSSFFFSETSSSFSTRLSTLSLFWSSLIGL